MKNINLKVVLLMLSIVVLFISGCGGNNNTGDLSNPYVGGTQALAMEFITGAPPNEVFDNNKYPFTVSIKLENKGESDVNAGAGFLKIKSINPEEFGVTASSLKVAFPTLTGTKKNADQSILQGQTDVVSFPELKYKKDEPGNFQIDNFRVLACYDYQTKSSSKLCVKEKNIDGIKSNEICLINEDKTSVSSGAPIQVSNLKETSRGNNGIQISFDVTHVGEANNKWFNYGNLECDDSVNNLDLYAVGVAVDPIIDGQYTAKCSNFNGASSGTVRLYNGEPIKVICSFDIADQKSDFETRVNINLKYRYMQYIEKALVIKDLGASN